MQATGNKKDACEQLKPVMPGLAGADQRKKLDELYQ
jgi:hypothetical protein